MTTIGRPLFSLRSLSRFFSNAPPPVSTIPESTISAASSGGVCSSAIRTVSTMASICSEMATLTSSESMARILGIPEGEAACDVIANRLTEKFDIGLINGERFLTGVRFNGINPEIVCDKSFIVTPTEPTAVEVRNLAVGNVASSDDVSDPQDGRLDLVVANKGKGGFWKRRKQAPATVLPLKRFAFDSKRDAVAEVDGRKIRDTRFRVRLDAKKIKVIVGKDRMF